MPKPNKAVLMNAIATLIDAGVLYGRRGNRIRIPLFKDAQRYMKTRPVILSPEGVMGIWNTHAHELLPRVVGLTTVRVRRANRLVNQFKIEDFKNAIEKINCNKWALGQSKNPKYKGWRFNFDYLLKPGIMIRILEGWLDEPEVLDDIDRREKLKNG